MLSDVLPRDEAKQIRQGCFAVFTDRRKTVLSSTSADYPVGSRLPLSDALFRHKNGERESAIVELAERYYAVGIQVSEGYREYKQDDGYVNDVLCMIFAAI